MANVPTHEEVQEGLKQARKDREAELAEIQKKYPVNPSDPKEVQERNKALQEVAQYDP